MGNACVAREDSPEEDRRAYEAYRRLWTEVRATLHDSARLQNECHQSFRMACGERGVQQLTKPLLQEMTNHFIRRLSCDNPRMVQSIHQHLDAMCPHNSMINQAQFTEFTRSVLTHIERDLRDKLEKLQQKNGGSFPPFDGQGGSAYSSSQPLSTAEARPRGELPANGAPRPPDTVSTPQFRGPPPGEGYPQQSPYPQGDSRPAGFGAAPPERRCSECGSGLLPDSNFCRRCGTRNVGEEPKQPLQPQLAQPQPAAVYAPPPEPVKPTNLAAQQRLQPVPTQQPPASFTPNPGIGAQQPPPGAARGNFLDLLPGTGTFPEPTKGRPGFDSAGGVGQQPSVQLVANKDVEVTFGKDGDPRGGGPPKTDLPGEMVPVDPGAPPEKGGKASLPEYQVQALEDMKREILCGNLRVQVYNQHLVLEVKRLALNDHMKLIAIFGDDGKAVASFEIRDLQCITQGIATSIMDPAPPPDRSIAFRFKDRFLCVVFDREDLCCLALEAFSHLCDVPIEGS